MRLLNGIVMSMAEGAIKGAATGALKSSSGTIAAVIFDGDIPPLPPAPPFPPSPSMIAPEDERQNDALVFLGLCLSVAIPGGMIMRTLEEMVEEGSWSDAITYDRLPVWLLVAYAFSAAAFGQLFSHGKDASALESTHYALASCAMLCAVRHSHRLSAVSRRASGAIIISFLVAFSVVLFFRTSMHTERCKPTMAILTVFCAAPCWRVYSARKRLVGEPMAEKARRRGALISVILVVGLALQPWLGVCMHPVTWAESVQMAGEMAVLALATDNLWS